MDGRIESISATNAQGRAVGGDWYFPGYDNNGNVIGYWDETGALVAEYVYDAFGNTIFSSGSMVDVFPHRFSTKYYDADTDLYYYGYRHYSPSLGRWISRDPIEEEGGLNLYAFCENSPFTSLDFFGLEKLSLVYLATKYFMETERQEARQRHLPNGTVSVDSQEQLLADIRKRLNDSSNNKKECSCVNSLTMILHGVEGQIWFFDNLVVSANIIRSGRRMAEQVAAGNTAMTDDYKKNLAIFQFLNELASLMCSESKIEFTSCESGKGQAGKELQNELESIFSNSSIVLHKKKVSVAYKRIEEIEDSRTMKEKKKGRHK